MYTTTQIMTQNVRFLFFPFTVYIYTHAHTDAAKRLTPATAVGVSNFSEHNRVQNPYMVAQ